MKYYILYNYKSTLEEIVSKSKKKKKEKKPRVIVKNIFGIFCTIVYNCCPLSIVFSLCTKSHLRKDNNRLSSD